MNESREIGADEFLDAMAPAMEALKALAVAVEATGPRHGNLPDPESEAMKELASEDEYRARSGWLNPITDTHNFGSQTLWAAADYVRSFASTFGGERPPIYGHLALARDVLEASVVSFWLNQREIAYDERVKRGLCEVIYSASEFNKLGLTGSEAKLAEAKKWADDFGWRLAFPYGKPEVDGTKRRSVPEGIRSLLVDDEGARLGKFLWSRLSAVTHVAWWGLAWALDFTDVPADDGSGFATVPVGTDSSKVQLQALCIMRALRVAATGRFALMGWIDAQWESARQAAEQHELALLKAIGPGT